MLGSHVGAATVQTGSAAVTSNVAAIESFDPRLRNLASESALTLTMHFNAALWAQLDLNMHKLTPALAADRRICANLFLQQLLYFTVIFDIGWLLFWWAYLIEQVGANVRMHAYASAWGY